MTLAMLFGWVLFADAATSEWVPLITAVANIGFSVVVAWYLLAKAIPALQDKFSNDLTSQRADFQSAIDREREALGKVVTIVTDARFELLRHMSEKVDALVTEQKRGHEIIVRMSEDIREILSTTVRGRADKP